MPVFNYSGKDFFFDGKPIRIISGAMHYFRVLPQYWEDRMIKLKALGCNTLETYVAWKLHERSEGRFTFEGDLDIVKYIKLAGSLGLHVIVRPGPYICSEFDFGGMPGWILKDKNINLRCSDKIFMKHVDRYFSALLPLLIPLQCTYGGPVIAMQIENEYGAYGNDSNYLSALRQMMTCRGVDVMLFTSDNPVHHMLQGGTLPDVFATLNFGTGPVDRFRLFEKYQTDRPLMCMEFWIGWFDQWGGTHNTGSVPEQVAETLETMLKMGASVNFYMFHGGTNFGFTNGANKSNEKYEPDVTNYDYGALLDEAGDPTEKYYLCRDVIAKYAEGVDTSKFFEPSPKSDFGKVCLTSRVGFFDALDKLSDPVRKTIPESMELLDQDMGFIHYHTWLSGPRDESLLAIQELHDRAIIFIDKAPVQTLQYGNPSEFRLSVPDGGVDLDILVENMGRVNYGPLMKDYKGITEGVRFSNQFLFGWDIYTLPLDNLHLLVFSDNFEQCHNGEPQFLRGFFDIDIIADTFLKLDGFIKGCAYINGFNIGRYWESGPQVTLFVPGALLRNGKNEIVIFELHGFDKPEIEFTDHPILGQ